jgi:hypothetical protein
MDETAIETEGDFLARIPEACDNIHKSRIFKRCARKVLLCNACNEFGGLSFV